ncbi:hypothetical protein, partial [Shewanella sp. MBTL60-007]|uniref:hypothetical protein n=1 Tax=Shewanella sp. MBTL60-007 TaxID=2815911 RepID=UPI001C7F4658
LSLESTNKKTISPKIFNDLRVTFDILSKIENKKDRFKKTAAVLNRLSKKAFFKTSKGINNKHVIFFDVNKGGKIRRRGFEISINSELKSFDKQLHNELNRTSKDIADDNIQSSSARRSDAPPTDEEEDEEEDDFNDYFNWLEDYMDEMSDEFEDFWFNFNYNDGEDEPFEVCVGYEHVDGSSDESFMCGP